MVRKPYIKQKKKLMLNEIETPYKCNHFGIVEKVKRHHSLT